LKKFTLAEVSELNSPEGEDRRVVIAIHGKVYDVAKFLDEHPGGRDILLENAGTLASQAFDDIGHSSDAKELMKNFVIGELVEAEAIEVSEDTGPNEVPPLEAPEVEVNGAQESQEAKENLEEDNNWKSYILPLVITLLASGLYRLFSR